MKPSLIFHGTKRLSLWDQFKLWRALKDKDMIAKLKSRKLWVTVAVAALSALLSQLGFDTDLIEKIITMGMTYVGAQGLVDAVTAYVAPAAEPAPEGN